MPFCWFCHDAAHLFKDLYFAFSVIILCGVYMFKHVVLAKDLSEDFTCPAELSL